MGEVDGMAQRAADVRWFDVSQVDVGLAQRIAAEAARHHGLVAAPGLDAAWRIDNPYSTVWCLRFSAPSWTCRYFAKLAKGPHVNRDALRAQLVTEYEVLCRLARSSTNTADAASVEALAWFPDLPAIVTIEAPGLTLRQLYARRARRVGAAAGRADLLQRVCRAGEWLRRFQDSTAQGKGAFPIDSLVSYCNTRLQRLVQRHPGTFSPQDADRIVLRMKALAATLPAEGVALCGRHNDFASHNLIALAAGGIRVLDFQSYDEGPSAFDPCNFWYELELLKLDPSYSADLLSEMQRSFLQAYGRIEPDAPSFRLARIRYGINRLFNELDAGHGLHRWSLRRWRCIRETRTWLTAVAGDL
jgi:hypothetical protein